jgi:hypothetical protein
LRPFIGVLTGLAFVAALAAQEKGKESPLVAKTRIKLRTPVTVDYKDERLADVLKDLKRQLDEKVSFWIDNAGGVSNNLTLTYQAKEKPLAEVLDEMFKKYDLGYVIGKPKDKRYEGWVIIKRGKHRGDEEDAKAAARPDKGKADAKKPEEKSAPQPEDAAAKLEQEAARKLKFAKMFEADGLKDRAKERYKEIVDKYPSTSAAKEAKKLLEKLNP